MVILQTSFSDETEVVNRQSKYRCKYIIIQAFKSHCINFKHNHTLRQTCMFKIQSDIRATIP